MKIIYAKTAADASKKTAELLISEVKNNPKIVFGFPTGGTPVPTYKLLAEDYKKNKTDWSKITIFNLDEYVGLDKSNNQSYYYYMKHNVYDPLKLSETQTFIPKGTGDYLAYAEKYDDLIKEHGGIDVQLITLGRNGHIAYNEPPADFKSLTRLIKLTENTIEANSRFFNSKDEVPKEAISMGIQSIMNAKKIILLVIGSNKFNALKAIIDGKVNKNIPCTILLKHDNLVIVADEDAISKNKSSK